MHVSISLDKAKYLAEEINQTAYAGSDRAMFLNDLIAGTEMLIEIVPGTESVCVIDVDTAKGAWVYGMFNFFNDVGMLSR